MTREVVKKLLPIIQAFAEGKTIQVRINNDSSWTDLLDDKLEISNLYKYRIKPESKYRPFKSQEECWQEMHNHPDLGWVKSKHSSNYFDISMIYRSCGQERIMVNNSSYTLAQALEIFTFTNGTPFGIKEE